MPNTIEITDVLQSITAGCGSVVNKSESNCNNICRNPSVGLSVNTCEKRARLPERPLLSSQEML